MITINYYEWPELALEFQSRLQEPASGLNCFVVALVPLQKKPQTDGGQTKYAYEGCALEDYREFTMKAEGQAWVRQGLDPGTLRVGIPIQSGNTVDDFKVMIDIGSPQERILALGTPPMPFTYTWFGSNWKAAHLGDANANPPYAGYYTFTGWESVSPRVIQRIDDRSFGPYQLSTTVKLIPAETP
jgi:hypothetical protein